MRFSVITFTILFGILSLAPNMQGGQFFKFSEVIEHYEKHQVGDEPFNSFIAFVKDHYFTNHKTNDNEQNLPFKSTVVSAFVLLIHCVELQPIHESIYSSEEQENCFGEQSSFVQSKDISIWNPPRVC